MNYYDFFQSHRPQSLATAKARPVSQRSFLRFVCGVAVTVFSSTAVAEEDAAAAPPVNTGNDVAQAPKIVPPRLIRFQSAPYPEEALKAQVEGAVLLKLHIDVNGTVVDAAVVESAGNGFDEAAQMAARNFVFEPAVRGGKVVSAKILYRYQFVLSTAAPEGHSSQLAAPKTGELRGTVLAGDPPVAVPSARLAILGPFGATTWLTTDSSGGFVSSALSPGKYGLEISVPGFEVIRANEEILANKVTSVRYMLAVKNENAFEVTVHGSAIHREVSHYELAREELVRVPGTMGDAIHAVEAMPSVARAPAFSGMLIVRGSSPNDSQVFVEGTLVPRVFHYGSLSSVVPSEMIESIEFYPSNFSARYGRGMGGIIEVGLREINADGKYHGSAQIDFINTRANVEGPLPWAKGWSFMAGARSSYVDRWLAPVLRGSGSAIDGLPRYADYQVYLERKLPRQGVFRLGYFGATDKYVPVDRDSNDWHPPTDSFGHVQSLLRMPLSPAVRLKASWSLGIIRGASTGDNDARNTSLAHLGTARTELSARTGSIGTARVGTDLLYAPFEIRTESYPRERGALANALTDDPRMHRVVVRDVFFRPAAYGEYEYTPSGLTNITLGARADYTRETHEWNYAPRLALRQRTSDSSSSPTIKAGIGVFYQPPQPGQNIPDLGGTAGLTSARATHLMLGGEQPLGGKASLSIELFEKELRRLVYRHVDGSGNSNEDNSGKGRVYGADILLRIRPGGRFFGWVSYTISRSVRKTDSDHPYRLFIYDQTHILNILANYNLGRGWEFGGRFRYMSGFLYDSTTGGMFDNASGGYIPYGNTSRRRMAPFHQLDLRVEKAFIHESYKWSVYLDVINAYYHASPDYMTRSYDFSQSKPLSMSLPLLPSVGVRGEF